jgi:hypothetical protein
MAKGCSVSPPRFPQLWKTLWKTQPGKPDVPKHSVFLLFLPASGLTVPPGWTLPAKVVPNPEYRANFNGT